MDRPATERKRINYASMSEDTMIGSSEEASHRTPNTSSSQRLVEKPKTIQRPPWPFTDITTEARWSMVRLFDEYAEDGCHYKDATGVVRAYFKARELNKPPRCLEGFAEGLQQMLGTEKSGSVWYDVLCSWSEDRRSRGVNDRLLDICMFRVTQSFIDQDQVQVEEGFGLKKLRDLSSMLDELDESE
ncbi:MAG: hypothetical protein Q9180_008641 [Flavoplaca navasiana]